MLITIYIIEGESSFEGYGFDLLESGEERGEFSIIYQEITRCHHFESMILFQDKTLPSYMYFVFPSPL